MCLGSACVLCLPKDVLALVLRRVSIADRMSVLLTCKWFLHVALHLSWPPWENRGAGFFFACERGYVQYYLTWSAVAGYRWDPNMRSGSSLDRHGAKSFLSVACRANQKEMVQALLCDSRVRADVDNNIAIIRACANGHTDLVKLLLARADVNPGVANSHPIVVAAGCGFTEIVRLLLADPRVDPSSDDNYAFTYACESGNVETVRLLLQDCRVDPTWCHNRALRWAKNAKLYKVVQLLLSDARVASLPMEGYSGCSFGCHIF